MKASGMLTIHTIAVLSLALLTGIHTASAQQLATSSNTIDMSQIPQGMDFFSDYIDGIPTKLTLPGGRVIDLSIPDAPENDLAQRSGVIITTPVVPKPFDTVVLRVVNYTTKVLEDEITWSVNGKVVANEVGKSIITVQIGAAGVPYRIRAVINSRSLGIQLPTELTITPGDIAVLWEADTYTPPFYRGKALPSYRSSINLVPLPTIVGESGKRARPEKLLYTWKRNYQTLSDISGFGKTSARIEMGLGVQEDIFELTAKDLETGATAERKVIIKASPAKILFYAGTPLQGINYGQALGSSYNLNTQEVSIVAEPYFFSRSELGTNDALLSWTQNGSTIPAVQPRTILLRNESGTGGTSRIQASIANKKKSLQNAVASVMINFNK